MSRKADADTQAPLCGPRVVTTPFPGITFYETFIGCHQQFDRYRPAFNAKHPDFNPKKAAAQTEADWQAWLSTQQQTGAMK